MSIVEMKVPVIGESISEVTLSQWLKADGEYVKIDEPICEFESDKATLEFPAEASGKLIYVAAEEDDLEIGAMVAKIDTSIKAPAGSDIPVTPQVEAPKAESPVVVAPAPAITSYATGHPSPSAAKIMRESRVDAANVKGTGVDGRITKDDAQKAASNPGGSTHSITTSITPIAGVRTTRREKMSRMRRTIATRLVSAKNNTAMLTTFNEVDLSELMAMRKKYQEKFVEKHGVKLGFMSFFVRACTEALKRYPAVNASLDGADVVYHGYQDIGVAVSSPRGLVVPVLRNVDSMGLAQVEKEIRNFGLKARDGKLSIDEMTGGTFTISNGGVFGSLLSTPILNPPQTAILGMHKIQERPMAVSGEVVVLPMMYLALSYDHRMIDGKEAVQFLVTVKELLEDPTRLLLEI